MSFLKSKKFWFSLAHFGIIGGGVAAAILLPGSGLLIGPALQVVNALIPSPLSK